MPCDLQSNGDWWSSSQKTREMGQMRFWQPKFQQCGLIGLFDQLFKGGRAQLVTILWQQEGWLLAGLATNAKYRRERERPIVAKMEREATVERMGGLTTLNPGSFLEGLGFARSCRSKAKSMAR